MRFTLKWTTERAISFPHVHEVSFLYWVLNASTLNVCNRLVIGLVYETVINKGSDRRPDMIVLVIYLFTMRLVSC